MRRMLRQSFIVVLVVSLAVDSVSACRILRRCCRQISRPRIFRTVCPRRCPPPTCFEVPSGCDEAAWDTGFSIEPTPLPATESEEPTLPVAPVPDPLLPAPEMPATFSAPQDALPMPQPEIAVQEAVQDDPQLPAASLDPTQPVDVPVIPEEPEEATNEPSEVVPEVMPAEEPETNSLDDLLESTEPAEPLEPDSPPEEAAASQPEKQEPTEEPAEEEPKEEEAEEEKEITFEDLFGSQKRLPVLGEPGGLASEQLRLWSDNTGRFGCQARLLRITTQEVVLQKASGKERQVALSRLSDADLRFVHRQVIAQRQQLAQRNAIEKLATTWAD